MLPCSQRALILVLEHVGDFGVRWRQCILYACVFKFQAFMLQSDQCFHHVRS